MANRNNYSYYDILDMINNGTLTSASSPYDLGYSPNAVIPGHNWQYGNWNLNGGLPAMRRSVVTNNPASIIDADFSSVATGAGSPPNPPSNPPKGPLKNWFSGLSANSGWNLTGNSKFGIGNTNGKAGLTLGGKNLAPISNILTGAYQGINAIKGMSDISKNENSRQSLLSKIRASAAGNPMLSSYLTSDQMSQLNKIRRGYNDESPSADFDLGGILGGAGKGALTGIAGGLPGMLIGAIGGGINAGINSKNQAITNDTENLESLYQALANAENDYRRMRIPNYTGLGLQSRFTNQWM